MAVVSEQLGVERVAIYLITIDRRPTRARVTVGVSRGGIQPALDRLPATSRLVRATSRAM
ncbi:MAG: hypothetical protein ACRD9R_05360 [Pyrinomonadaceae bacterium]